MEYGAVVEIINSVGFPIACCVALFYHNHKQDERYDQQMKELSKVIETNTLTLTELCTRLEGGCTNGKDR